jgi:hypothetical protein
MIANEISSGVCRSVRCETKYVMGKKTAIAIAAHTDIYIYHEYAH